MLKKVAAKAAKPKAPAAKDGGKVLKKKPEAKKGVAAKSIGGKRKLADAKASAKQRAKAEKAGLLLVVVPFVLHHTATCAQRRRL